MKRTTIFASLLLAVTLSASGQELKTGIVYSYVKDGVRHYSAKPPPPGSSESRAIQYSFVDTSATDLRGKTIVYRCDGTKPFLTVTPVVGCVVHGALTVIRQP